MKACFTILQLLLIPTSLLAQPTIQWQKTYGGDDFDEPKCIIQTTDGGYIVTGNVLSTNGNVMGNHGVFDYWVLKLNPTGGIDWKKTYGGDDNDWPYDIRQTNDGGYIIAGFTESNNGDVSGNHGDKDAWIVKLSATGAIEWQKTYGGSNWDAALSIQQTSDGGYIFAGIAASNDGDVTGLHGDLDFWVVKLSHSGAIQWQRTFGGSGQDNASAIRQTADGGYIVVGDSQSNDGDAQGNHGNVDYLVLKLSDTGILEWQKLLGGIGGDFANDVQQTSDGGFLVAGNSGSYNTGDVTGHHGAFDYWLVKLGSTGNTLWQKSFGGSESDRCQSITVTNDGMYVAFGDTESTDGDVLDNDGGVDGWAIKINNEGELIWQKTLGGTQAESGYHIEQTSDNGYILTGYAWSTNGDLTGSTIHGYNDFWVVKLAPETVSTDETPQPFAGQFEVFPNPAQQSITMKTSSDATELAVVLIDVLGRRVLEKNTQNGGTVQIALLPDGVYWVQATDEAGKMYSAKLNKKE